MPLERFPISDSSRGTRVECGADSEGGDLRGGVNIGREGRQPQTGFGVWMKPVSAFGTICPLKRLASREVLPCL